MASIVSICNHALTELGANLITSLDDGSTEAKVMKAAYDDVRDSVLREVKPLCATFRASLAKTTSPAFGWANAFQLPTDPYCLAITELDGVSDKTEWEVEGRNLVTDHSTAQIKYIGRVTDSGQFDSLLRKAIALSLAAQTCYAINQSRTQVADLRNEAKAAIFDAQSADGMERGGQVIKANRFASARR